MKKWFALCLAVLMLCALVGCGEKAKTDDKGKDTPTTTTNQQEVAPISLLEGEIPSDCYRYEDASIADHNVAVTVQANVNLVEFSWLALNPDPPTVERVLYTRTLNKDEIWTVNTYINDAVPNRGIACTDKDGKTYYYAVTYSMKGDDSPSLSLTALDISPLSAAQLDEIEAYLNAEENNGFVSFNHYTRPEEASLDDILYDRTAGQHHSEWSEAERQAWLDANDFTEDYFVRPVYRFYRTDLEVLIQQKLGISLSVLENTMLYLEEYDAYYDYSHSDSQRQQVEVESGYAEGDLYTVTYKIRSSDSFDYEWCRVVLKPTEDGYQFVSNVEIAEETDAVDLSDTQLEEIETYLNAEENNGFVSMNEYFDSKDVSLFDALYNIGVPYWEWTDAETDAYLKATGQTDKEAAFLSVVFRHDRAKTEALIQEKLGISITLSEDNMKMRYIEELDAFFDSHTDTSYQTVEVVDGYASGGMYYIDYELAWGDIGRVVLLPVEDGYRFIANIYTNE